MNCLLPEPLPRREYRIAAVLMNEPALLGLSDHLLIRDIQAKYRVATNVARTAISVARQYFGEWRV
jgi:hypothetical protein